ncbi:hypothetical protein AB0758_46560 [Tolypothrix bouteillei VB521301_2]|uniref:hypothetical protein n=1 Tax=Tolypothrix bouteillei TaxID=1246981 RepID=UPI0038B547D6
MKEQLTQRLQELKTEFEAGQKVLTELEAKQASVRDMLLRLSGAIQVLEEELAKAEQINGSSKELVYVPEVSGASCHNTGETRKCPGTLEQLC